MSTQNPNQKNGQNPRVITANRLTDGVVVFLANTETESGVKETKWTEDVDQSWLLHDDISVVRAEEIAAKFEAEQYILGSYDIEVTTCAERHVRPVRFRERIRAYGPPSHPEFGRGDHPGHYQDGGAYQSPTQLSGV